MDPRIWSQLPSDLLPGVLRHLPWWSNMQLRRTSTFWNALLSDLKFLEKCPPGDPSAKPCFISITLLEKQQPEPDSKPVLQTSCMRSNGDNSDDPLSTKTVPGLSRLSLWRKWQAAPTMLVRSNPVPPCTCKDTANWVGGRSHTGLPPARAIFLGVVEFSPLPVVLLINPFNSTFRRIPEIPNNQHECDPTCRSYAQLVADDADQKNIKLMMTHFKTGVWTLRVYDLLKGSWFTQRGDMPTILDDQVLNPTSITLLSKSIYVLVQELRKIPRLLRITGDKISVYPMPRFPSSIPNNHVFRHGGSLMLATAICLGESLEALVIWKSASEDKQKSPIWVKIATMPEVLVDSLQPCKRRGLDGKMVKFHEDEDFLCVSPTQEVPFKSIVLLDLIKLRWHLIGSSDGEMDGFFVCQPRLDIVL
ncbi:hypothetical protein R1flu_026118 [Riccia fluitans]|uniref:F-box domain-containing protein n=1 Tax=Riccia fluitans TaxID=41844 RepID=A0ABD1XF31_9MARC